MNSGQEPSTSQVPTSIHSPFAQIERSVAAKCHAHQPPLAQSLLRLLKPTERLRTAHSAQAEEDRPCCVVHAVSLHVEQAPSTEQNFDGENYLTPFRSLLLLFLRCTGRAMLSVLSCGVAMVAAHGFTIYPPARNSIDKDLPMFGPGTAFALTAQALACQRSSQVSGQIHA